MYSIFNRWAHCDYFVSVNTMSSQCTCWVFDPLPPVTAYTGNAHYHRFHKDQNAIMKSILDRSIAYRNLDDVIALTFFALFSLPSLSFFSYDFTTLSLFLYPSHHSFAPFLLSPPFTRVKSKTKRPTAFF